MNTNKEADGSLKSDSAFSFGGVYYDDSSQLQEGPGFTGSEKEIRHAEQLAAARKRFSDLQAKAGQPKPAAK